MISVIVFLFGLVVGSFLNCVIYRLETGGSFLKGRSYCPHCKHKLFWQDLIPLLSFFVLRGRCRYCGKKISLQYPFIEMATGLLFVLIFNFQVSTFNQFPISNPQFLISICFLFFVSCFLLIIFVYDLKHFIIPDSIIYSAIILTLLFWVLNFGACNLFGICNLEFEISKIWNFILAGMAAGAFFLAIVLATRGKAMGVGDIKLAFFMGFLLGFPKILVALFFAFLIGAIIGIGLILARKKTLKSEVPFGPFLVTGTFTALFWGDAIIDWYLNLFGIY